MLKKLNDAILNIKQKKQDTATLEYLTRLKSEVAKGLGNGNYSENARLYDKLGQLEHSLYRYNEFVRAGMDKEAVAEGEKFINLSQNSDGSIVLKGGISNTRYVWRTEAGACNVCQELDGITFDSIDEVPEHPHPNCKCETEPVPDDNKDDEPCDCWEQIDSLIAQIDESVQEAENLSGCIENDIADIEADYIKSQTMITETEQTLAALDEEYGKHLPECKYNIDSRFEQVCYQRTELQSLSGQILGILSPITALLNTVRVFVSNYISLLYEAYVLKQWGMDKFRHAKANCEATQQMGILGEMYATNLSDFKELYDQYTYVHSHKVTIEEALADSERDQMANRFGREMGRRYPDCDCSFLLRDLLPNYKK